MSKRANDLTNGTFGSSDVDIDRQYDMIFSCNATVKTAGRYSTESHIGLGGRRNNFAASNAAMRQTEEILFVVCAARRSLARNVRLTEQGRRSVGIAAGPSSSAETVLARTTQIIGMPESTLALVASSPFAAISSTSGTVVISVRRNSANARPS
jgi:hypothetical protein